MWLRTPRPPGTEVGALIVGRIFGLGFPLLALYPCNRIITFKKIFFFFGGFLSRLVAARGHTASSAWCFPCREAEAHISTDSSHKFLHESLPSIREASESGAMCTLFLWPLRPREEQWPASRPEHVVSIYSCRRRGPRILLPSALPLRKSDRAHRLDSCVADAERNTLNARAAPPRFRRPLLVNGDFFL